MGFWRGWSGPRESEEGWSWEKGGFGWWVIFVIHGKGRDNSVEDLNKVFLACVVCTCMEEEDAISYSESLTP